MKPDGSEWFQTYPTRIKAHVAYHNRIRISPSGTEVYMYDLDKQVEIKMRVKP